MSLRYFGSLRRFQSVGTYHGLGRRKVPLRLGRLLPLRRGGVSKELEPRNAIPIYHVISCDIIIINYIPIQFQCGGETLRWLWFLFPHVLRVVPNQNTLRSHVNLSFLYIYYMYDVSFSSMRMPIDRATFPPRWAGGHWGSDAWLLVAKTPRRKNGSHRRPP